MNGTKSTTTATQKKGIEVKKSPILVGDLVDYHAVIGGPITSQGHIVETIGSLNGGKTPVAWITCKSGCVAIVALTPSVPLTEHSEHVIGNPVLVTATAKHSCDDCYGQGEDRHYCDLHGIPVKNMNVTICRDWQPEEGGQSQQ